MTQEVKELLLKDLCARLPYNVICSTAFGNSVVLYIDIYEGTIYIPNNEWVYDFKPYLRPMSSMTDEEKKEYYTFQYKFTLQAHEYQELNKETFSEYLDWLNKNMFDYRGLIDKGLALEAPEGMYGKEEQSLILKEKLIKEIFTKSGFYGNFIPTKEKLNKLNEAYKEAIESLYRGNDE